MENLVNKDLNLLVLFVVIWEERKLSSVAKRLYLSQPAVSHALNKMRAQFNDPLFVKSPKGVTPTDFAIRIADSIIDQVYQLDRIFTNEDNFDPSKVERKISMAVGDYFAGSILSPLHQKLGEEAPKVKLVCYPDRELFNPVKLISGEIHLGLSGFEFEPAQGFVSEILVTEPNVCCVRKDHPLAKSKLTLSRYLKYDHVLVSVVGKSFGLIDEKLKKLKKTRNNSAVVTNYNQAGQLLSHSDLILTAPKGICQDIAAIFDLKILPIDFVKLDYSLNMIWHHRTETDPFHLWIRQQIRDIVKRGT